jgi:hypothetical protein
VVAATNRINRVVVVIEPKASSINDLAVGSDPEFVAAGHTSAARACWPKRKGPPSAARVPQAAFAPAVLRLFSISPAASRAASTPPGAKPAVTVS